MVPRSSPGSSSRQRTTLQEQPHDVPQGADGPRPARRRRPLHAALPRHRGARPGVLEGRRHLPRERRRPRPRRRRFERVRLLRRSPVRQRPAPLRAPADRLREGPRAPLPDDARPPGRASVRLGHARAAGRARGDAAQRHQDDRRDRRNGHRPVQRGVPRVGAEVHRRVGGVRDAPGPLGRLRARLPHAEPGVHGVGHLGVQAAAREGPRVRGLQGAALLLERRDAAVEPRAADGRRRRGRCRRTSRSWSGPASTTWPSTTAAPPW